MDTFTYRSIVPARAREVFAWHEQPEALLALAPARLPLEIESRSGGIRNGGQVTFAMVFGPLRLRWHARHYGYIPGVQFCDEQVAGPFKSWRHVHRTEPFGSDSCLYEDRIEFALPGGRLSELALGPLVHFMLGHMFARRHRIVRELFVDRRDAWLRRAS